MKLMYTLYVTMSKVFELEHLKKVVLNYIFVSVIHIKLIFKAKFYIRN